MAGLENGYYDEEDPQGLSSNEGCWNGCLLWSLVLVMGVALLCVLTLPINF